MGDEPCAFLLHFIHSPLTLFPQAGPRPPTLVSILGEETEAQEASVPGLCMTTLKKLHSDLEVKFSPGPSQPADLGPTVALCPTCDHAEPSQSTAGQRVCQSQATHLGTPLQGVYALRESEEGLDFRQELSLPLKSLEPSPPLW